MPGQIGNSGGKKGRSGRKPKAVEDDLVDILKRSFTKADREKVFKQLVTDALSLSFSIRNESRKLLLAYVYGKPIERHEVEGSLDVNVPSPEDLKKRFAERRKQVESLDD